jgi:type 1 fimbriae regulatory protein FimB/type 1 fimbriae regulatory protein FimE
VTNADLQLIAPSPVFGTVATPRRKTNAELRPRESLTEAEVERLRKTARAGNRNGHRDETMILVAFRHGLRASELVTLRWDAIDLEQGKLHCCRRKNGAASVHPLTGVELQALRRVRRESPQSPYVFANDGRDTRAIQHYLGHRNIQHTVAYTALASDRFKGFWTD